MKWLNDSKITLLLVVLVLWPAQSPAKEYVLTVGNEQLRFIPQAEKGYVVKQPKPKAGISALAGTLFLEEGQVQPIGGLDRHGIWIVENDGPSSRNDAVMAELIYNGAAEYVAPLFSSNGEIVAVIPEIVIRVHPGVDARQVHFLCESLSLAIIKPMEFTTQEYLLQVLGPDAEAVFTALENLNNVEWIEWAAPNTASQPKLCGQVIPNDEYFPMQWHWQNTGQSGGTPGADIRAPEAWEITRGDPNIVVAVLDSGVDSNHPDLVNNLVPGYDFYDNDDRPDPSTDHWLNAHGTCCAGLIAARGNNSIGVTGVTWNCKVMPIRIFSVRADGTEVWTTQADRATALRWAAANGADILSNSWSWGQNPLPIIYSGIVDVTQSGGIGRGGKGCVVLFAAGNYNGPVRYPARYPEVIAVGATDHNDLRSWWSDFGPELDIVAPGGGGVHTYDLDLFYTLSQGLLWTTDQVGLPGWNKWNSDPNILDYAEKFSGTSAATPVAAGVAAMILSVDPNLTNTQVQYILERSAKDLGDPGRDDYYGWGRVDARAALDMLLAKRADLNNDWKVDLKDFSLLAQSWNMGESSADIAPATRRDRIVDVKDLALLSQYWLQEIPEIPEPNRISHWKLDETEGTIAHDSISDKNGTLNGNPIWQPVSGAVRGALQLDGADDYVSTPFVLNPSSGPFTAMAWVKGGSPGQVVLSQQSTFLLPAGKDWLCADPTGGKLMTALTDGSPSTSPLVSEFVITDGEWHCIVVTWDGSRRRLYADGVKVAEDPNPLANLVSSNTGLNLGTGRNRNPGTFWYGLIDDVRIYNKAVNP